MFCDLQFTSSSLYHFFQTTSYSIKELPQIAMIKMLSLRLEVVACPRHEYMSFVAKVTRGTLVSLLQMKQATGQKLL